MDEIKYFAYGPNLNIAALESRGVRYKKVIAAQLKNWELVFDIVNPEIEGMGFADIVPHDGKIVEGAIFWLQNKQSRFALDKYEEFPAMYLREDVRVSTENGEVHDCFTYIANPYATGAQLRPTKAYLNEILKGKEFFSIKYLGKLMLTRCL
jgi:hypothetical protein